MFLFFAGCPKFKSNIIQEIEIYKKLTEYGGLPILTMLGYYNSDENQTAAIVFEERGRQQETVKGLHGIIPVLKALHDLGYLHRDVRPSNILSIPVEKKCKTLLIDFGFCTKITKEEPYGGTLSTASQKILKQIKEGKKSIIADSSDDIESVVKTMFLLIFNLKLINKLTLDYHEGRKGLAEAADSLFNAWECVKKLKHMENNFSDLWDIAQNCDYSALEQRLKQIEEEVSL